MGTNHVALTAFQDYYLTKPVEQSKLSRHLAYMMATAQCVNEKVKSAEEANQIYQDTLTAVEKYSVSPKLINSRQYNFLPFSSDSDAKKSPDKFSLTHHNMMTNPHGLSLNERMNLFENAVKTIIANIYPNKENLPDSIVHATCTGYLSPSPIQKFFSNNNWLTTQIIHSYHMGCYGSIPAVEIGMGLISAAQHSLAKARKRIDIIHTEMASVHLNAMDRDPGNIINMTLFGDGFIKYSAMFAEDLIKLNQRGLKIIAAETLLIKNSLTEMTWVPGPFQFDMYISKNVPLLVGEYIAQFMQNLCEQCGLDFWKIKDSINYAIHPGGPRILHHISEVLNLDDSKMQLSLDILRRYGNLSSATLPHIWKEIIASDKIKPGEKIITAAFGPGLTTTGFMFEKI